MCVLPNFNLFIWKVAGQLTSIDFAWTLYYCNLSLGDPIYFDTPIATKVLHLCEHSCHSWPAAMEVATCHPPSSNFSRMLQANLLISALKANQTISSSRNKGRKKRTEFCILTPACRFADMKLKTRSKQRPARREMSKLSTQSSCSASR